MCLTQGSLAAESEALRWAALVADNLPPRPLRAERVYALQDLCYPEAINLADTLLGDPAADPDRIAVRSRDDALTYRQLRHRVLGMAARLTAAGVGVADRVVLRMSNRTELVAAWLAVQWIGAIGVHLSPQYRRRETSHVVRDSSPVAIVCDAEAVGEIAAAAADWPACVRVLAAGEIGDAAAAPEPKMRAGDCPAVICYITSAGGPPKGAVMSATDILASADTYARQVLQLTASDVCVGTVSLAWAYGLGGLLTFPLRVGATTTLVEGAMNLLQTIADVRATVLFSVPTMYRMLLQHPGLSSCDVRSLRCCVSSAEPLPPPVAAAWRAATGLDIVDGFGTSELTHICISQRPGQIREGLLGTPVPGYEARVVDPAMREMANGMPGLLAVRGPTGACYWRNVDEQRRAVRDGWTLTGDVCIRQHDGWFRHVRRADALVVSAGYKISAREVEQTLLEHPDVSSAHAYAVADPVRGSVLKAVVARARAVDPGDLAEQLQRYLKTTIAPFKCPREIQVL